MKLTRILALLLCLVLAAGLFAGCTQSEPAATNTPAANSGTANSGTSNSGTSSSGSASSSTPAPAEEPQDNSSGLPLVDTPTSFDIWQPWGLVSFPSFLSDFNDCLGYQLLERDTGIHINWTIPASGTENEDFQIMMASLEYPDFIANFSFYYTQGMVHAVENEIAVPVDDLVNQYMPNYLSWISKDGTKLKVTTDEGYMAGLYCIDNMPQAPWAGLGIREDWLNRLGLAKPETYDEFHTVLVAFRDQIEGCESPMLLDGANIGGDNYGYNMASGFGAIGDFYAKNGTTVTYGPTQPEYLDYLRFIRGWYEEGLIDKDFTTRSLFADAPAYVFAGKAGLVTGFSNIGDYAELNGQPADENYIVSAVASPVKNKGDARHFGIAQENVEGGGIITTQCSDAALLARWYDYQYSETGALYLNYGEEGNTFFYDENGEPCLSSAGMEAFYGVPVGTCMQANGPISQTHLRYFYMNRSMRNVDQGARQYYLDAGPIWAVDSGDWLIPSFVTMTSEEATAYNAIYNDLKTYVAEISVKYIMGAAGEEDLATMQSTIQGMNVDRCIAIRQAALDRYLAR